MGNIHRVPGAEVRTVPHGDRFQPAMVFTCSDCAAELPVRSANGGLAPDFAARRARAQGWIADPHKAGANHCPACILKRRERPARTAPALPVPSALTQEPKSMPEPSKPASAAQPLSLVPAGKTLPPLVSAALRDPTQDERMRIRGVLDAHFDDKAGCYLGGMSDEVVGKKLNIPWALVTRIREAAYGPIRVNPELLKLQADIGTFGARLHELEVARDALLARVAAFGKGAAA